MEEFNQHHYHTPSSSSSIYTYLISDQAAKAEGLWYATSMRRSPVDTREEIQIELQKERIRERIVAKEIARIRDLDAELKREVGMHDGGGYHQSSTTFIIGPPLPSQLTTRFQPVIQPVQPLAPVEIYAVPHRREFGPFWSPRDGEPKVINLPDRLTDQKPPPPPPPPPAAAAGSSGLKHCSGGGEIGLGVAPKKSVKKQPSPIKNSRKCVPFDSNKEDKKTKLSHWCSMCGVGATSETGMSQHKEGKKHMKNVEKLNRESRGHRALGVRKRSSGIKPKKTKRKQKIAQRTQQGISDQPFS